MKVILTELHFEGKEDFLSFFNLEESDDVDKLFYQRRALDHSLFFNQNAPDILSVHAYVLFSYLKKAGKLV